MNLKAVKILWMVTADAENTNAQSLNAREVALRLDPKLFDSTFFYEHQPDPRLLQTPAIRLVELPDKRRTSAVLKEMFGGHQLITYMDLSPASYIFLHAPRALRRGALTVLHVEAPAGQLERAPYHAVFLRNGIVPLCDVHTGITEFIVREMESMGLRSWATLPVGVDTRRFSPPSIPRQPSVPTVLFAGTVMKRKGVHLIAEIARQVPDAQFLITGGARDGFDQVVISKVRELRLSNVQLLGPQSQARMIQIMRSSDVFLLPSQLEGIPKVTLEAAATGLPCVIFNTYQTPSVVDGHTGFQVATLQEMADSVKLQVHDADKRREMGAAAVGHAKNFDWDAIVVKWQEAYLRMACGPARLRPSSVRLC